MDRNTFLAANPVVLIMSPPARVAWIEITVKWSRHNRLLVATREGGVDRNTEEDTHTTQTYGRHPRGWRG